MSSFRDVVANGIPEYVFERPLLRDVARTSADHYGEFHLPIGLGGIARQDYVVIGSADRCVCLEKYDRFARYGSVTLLRVFAIVESDADNFADRSDRTPSLTLGRALGREARDLEFALSNPLNDSVPGKMSGTKEDTSAMLPSASNTPGRS